MEDKFQISEGDLAKYAQCHECIGRDQGLSYAASKLLERAGQHFANGNDDLAKDTRDTAFFIRSLREEQKIIAEGAEVASKEIRDRVFSNDPITK